MEKWKRKGFEALKWITIDMDGCVHAHVKKPKIRFGCCWKASEQIDLSEYNDIVFLGIEKDKTKVKNWKKSLTKLER